MKFLLRLVIAYALLIGALKLVAPTRPGKLVIPALPWGGHAVVCEETPLEGKKDYPCHTLSKEEYTKWLAGEPHITKGK